MEAVASLHHAGVVHLDIKPENVMLGSDGRLLLADFGTAMEIHELAKFGAVGVGKPIGTPAYMAPEAVVGAVSRASDVWSVGMTVQALANGRAPHSEVGKYSALDLFLHVVRLRDYEPPDGMDEDVHSFVCACTRHAQGDRLTAMQLLRHPLVVNEACAARGICG